jgi:hypothetical protein
MKHVRRFGWSVFVFIVAVIAAAIPTMAFTGQF